LFENKKYNYVEATLKIISHIFILIKVAFHIMILNLSGLNYNYFSTSRNLLPWTVQILSPLANKVLVKEQAG